MKNEKSRDLPISRIIRNDSTLCEFSTNEEYEIFVNVRNEMNQFMVNLNHSGLSESIPDQIHYLFMALSHIENVENEILGLCLPEEMIYQNKIMEDINCLKRMILDYVRDLSECK
jgi:hypothetical protein